MCVCVCVRACVHACVCVCVLVYAQSMKLKLLFSSVNAERRFSSWIGGSILASLVSTFDC
jgi:hypothetical protein